MSHYLVLLQGEGFSLSSAPRCSELSRFLSQNKGRFVRKRVRVGGEGPLEPAPPLTRALLS